MKQAAVLAAVIGLLLGPALAFADGTGVVATSVLVGNNIVVLVGDTGVVEWAGPVSDPAFCAKTGQPATPCIVLFGIFNGINIAPNGQSGAGTPGQEGIVFGPNQVKSR